MRVDTRPVHHHPPVYRAPPLLSLFMLTIVTIHSNPTNTSNRPLRLTVALLALVISKISMTAVVGAVYSGRLRHAVDGEYGVGLRLPVSTEMQAMNETYTTG